MPIYEFSCQKCSKEFELLVSHQKLGQLECPFCGATGIEKKFSTFSSASSHSNSAPCSGGSCPFSPMMSQGGSDCAGGSCYR